METPDKQDEAWAPPVEDPASQAVRLRGLPLLFWTLTVALAAGWLLTLLSGPFQPDELHVQDMYVDQLGYITTARILSDTGELRNGVLIPSQIENPRFRPYMPGHFYALAASYGTLGYGTFPTLLPSFVSYVLVAALVFLVGNRWYGRWAGALATALFALHPAVITYSFTAMAELTFTAAGMLALAAFAALPRRAWTFAPPLLLAIPFLFRETGAFLIIPLGLLIWRARGLVAALLATGGSVVTLKLINSWQIADGKLAASMAWVTRGGFNYDDAFAPPEPDLSIGEFLAAVGNNTDRNLGLLKTLLSDWPGELMPIGLVLVLAVLPLLLIGGLARRRSDPFPLGVGLLLLLVLGLTLTIYDVQAHKMMRTALFLAPWSAIALAGIVRPDRLAERWRARGTGRLRLGGFASVALLAAATYGSYGVCVRAGERMCRRDDAMENRADILGRVHDPETVIMGPLGIGPAYVLANYPVVWCFPAANLETYEEIRKRYRLGTVVSGFPYEPEDVEAMGLTLAYQMTKARSTLYVYKTGE